MWVFWVFIGTLSDKKPHRLMVRTGRVDWGSTSSDSEQRGAADTRRRHTESKQQHWPAEGRNTRVSSFLWAGTEMHEYSCTFCHFITSNLCILSGVYVINHHRAAHSALCCLSSFGFQKNGWFFHLVFGCCAAERVFAFTFF